MRLLVVGVAIAVVAVAADAEAQVAQVQPPNPTSVDEIVLRIAMPQNEMVLQPIVVSGSEIRITFRGGTTEPSGTTQFVSLGRLPAGVYSVILIFEFTGGGDEVLLRETLPPFILTVAAGFLPIPVLDPRALLGLVLALALVAVVAIRR